jgi:hypothetical protein
MAQAQQPFEEDEQDLLLYEKYGRCFESEHWGRLLVISSNGETMLGDDDVELLRRAAAKFGPGLFLFRVGEIAVGSWRWFSVQ